MLFPDYRPRRMRQSEAFRKWSAKRPFPSTISFLPLFAIDGKGVKNPIDAMPGTTSFPSTTWSRWPDRPLTWAIPAIILFGIPDRKRTRLGTQAYARDGIVQRDRQGRERTRSRNWWSSPMSACVNTPTTATAGLWMAIPWTMTPHWTFWPRRPCPMPRRAPIWWPRRT